MFNVIFLFFIFYINLKMYNAKCLLLGEFYFADGDALWSLKKSLL